MAGFEIDDTFSIRLVQCWKMNVQTEKQQTQFTEGLKQAIQRRFHSVKDGKSLLEILLWQSKFCRELAASNSVDEFFVLMPILQALQQSLHEK